MNLLKLTFIEFFFRTIPEWILLILVSFILNKRDICIKKVIISVVLLSICNFFIRMLPIHLGVHTIILFFFYVCISVFINKIGVIESIGSVIVSTIFLLICEGINAIILVNILHVNIKIIFEDPILKTLYGLPSLLIFSIVLFFFHKKIQISKKT